MALDFLLILLPLSLASSCSPPPALSADYGVPERSFSYCDLFLDLLIIGLTYYRLLYVTIQIRYYLLIKMECLFQYLPIMYLTY